MDEFVDMFSESIEGKKSDIIEDLRSTVEGELRSDIKQALDSNFVSEEIQEKKNDSFRVIAADAGRNKIEFRGNNVFYIIRASAIDSDGRKEKSMKVGTLKLRRNSDYERFARRTSETAELDAITDMLRESSLDKTTYVLIDGTLLTRMFTMPEELELDEEPHQLLKLIEKFQELLELYKEEENLVIAGVSKDSNSSIMFSKMMEDIIRKEIRSISTENRGVTREDLRELENNIEKAGYAPEEFLEQVENLEGSKNEFRRIKNLVEGYSKLYSDTEIINQLKNSKGYTKPLEVGRIKKEFFNRLDEIREDVNTYVENHFNTEDSEFKEDIVDILEGLLDYPGVTSFYWKPEVRDTPMRIDLLSSEFEGTERLKDFKEHQFLEPNQKVRDILELLKTGYAGEEMHNVWISQADNSASLSKKEIENVYKPMLEKQLGLSLTEFSRRRDKRA